MNKYKLRTINKKADLHKHDFVIYEDVLEALMLLVAHAIEAGADEGKMMEFFDREET
jgi:hypothetical protein